MHRFLQSVHLYRSMGQIDLLALWTPAAFRNGCVYQIFLWRRVRPLASFITRSFYRCSTVSMLCALSADACHAGTGPLFGSFFAGPVPAQRIDLRIERARSHLPNALLLPLLRPCPFSLYVCAFCRFPAFDWRCFRIFLSITRYGKYKARQLRCHCVPRIASQLAVLRLEPRLTPRSTPRLVLCIARVCRQPFCNAVPRHSQEIEMLLLLHHLFL